MTFGIDEQTLWDLDIFPRKKGDPSILGYYNLTKTKGGRDELEYMMRTPSNDLEEINYRISSIRFITDTSLACTLDNESLDFIEYYLNQNTPILRNNFIDSLWTWLADKIRPSNEYYIISRGIDYLRRHIKMLSDFADRITSPDVPEYFQQLVNEVDEINKAPVFKLLLKSINQKLTFRQLNRYDYLFRKDEKERIKKLLKLTYLLDAFLSVASKLKAGNLAYPTFFKATKPKIKIDGFFHPFLKEPVINAISLLDGNNLCFVSGANMAGKSTFLKSVGLCVYLSHVGFPVPAQAMELSVFNGLFTTINISDNINKGYSHYYSEVKRVKDITLMIKEKKRVLVIFDELFRGTNVKDAFDATLLITQGFTRIRSSLFFISTHIVEIGEELEKLDKVVFKCFECSLQGEKPIYNYKLTDGISTERLGLVILKNEKILELIDDIADS